MIETRKAALQALLKLLQSNRRGPQKVPDRKQKLQTLLTRVQNAPRRAR